MAGWTWRKEGKTEISCMQTCVGSTSMTKQNQNSVRTERREKDNIWSRAHKYVAQNSKAFQSFFLFQVFSPALCYPFIFCFKVILIDCGQKRVPEETWKKGGNTKNMCPTYMHNVNWVFHHLHFHHVVWLVYSLLFNRESSWWFGRHRAWSLSSMPARVGGIPSQLIFSAWTGIETRFLPQWRPHRNEGSLLKQRLPAKPKGTHGQSDINTLS